MKKKSLSVLLAGTMAAGLLAGCGNSSKTSGGTDSKGTITIVVKSNISSFNPHSHGDSISAAATRHIYNNLVHLIKDNRLVGDLADSWEYTDDATVAFTLKEGVKFRNSPVLASEDVKYSLESQKESSRVGHLVSMTDSVEVVDDAHFIIHLNAPSNALISSLNHSGCAILNKAYVEEQPAAGKEIEDIPMGTGPYKFEEQASGASYTLVKSEDYFDPEHAAQNDELVLKVIPEESAGTIALENGEVDLLLRVPTSDADKIRSNDRLKLEEYTNTQMEYFCVNADKTPFGDVRVKQTLSCAIDKDDILVTTIDGEGTTFSNCVGSAAVSYYDTVTKCEHGPEEAGELLAEADIREGFTFDCYLTGDIRARGATVIQANLAELGIAMKIEQMEASTFYKKTDNGEHDSYMAGWVTSAKPDNIYRLLFTSVNADAGGNRSFYHNPEVDTLVDDTATNRNKDAIAKDYQTVLQALSDDAVWVPLYSPADLVVHDKGLQGVVPSPIDVRDFYTLRY